MGRSIMFAMYLCFASFSNFLLAGCGPNPPCDTDCSADCQGAGFATGECVGGACQCSGDAGADADVDADADADGDGDGDGDADADHDADVEAAALDVVIEFSPWGIGMEPWPGVAVAFDAPSGDRFEAETGDDGRVHFEGFEWIEGETAAITTYSEGREMVTWTGLDEAFVTGRLEEDGAFHMIADNFHETEERTMIEISGTIANMELRGHSHNVSVNLPETEDDQNMGDDWSILVPAGEPLTIMETEYAYGGWSDGHYTQAFFGWTSVEHAGVTEPTSIDLDMHAPALEHIHYTGSIPIPDWAVEGDRPYIWASSLESNFSFFFGAATSMDLDWDRRLWTYDVECPVFEPSLTEITPIFIFQWPHGAVTGQAVMLESPDDFPGFLAPPEFVTPTHGGLHVGDNFEWTNTQDDGALITRIVLVTEEGSVASSIWAMNEAESAVIPAPPTGVDPEVVYGPQRIAYVQRCDPNYRIGDPCQARLTQTGTFSVEP